MSTIRIPDRCLRSTKLLHSIEASDGRIKLASATFHLVEAPTFKVKLERAER